MNEPIVVKGLKNPDGTVITEFFGKKPIDFIAVKGADGAIRGLDKFKLSGKLIGLFEERNSVNELVSSNGAALCVGSDSDVITQWLQTGDIIYTRKFENNAWSAWTGDSLSLNSEMTTALDGKADSDHTHDEISSGEARVYFEDGDVRVSGKDVVLDLSDSEGEDILRITESDLVNIARAKRNPDSTPTVDSDHLVTSGGVAAALAGKAASSHTQAISTITGLQTALDGKADYADGVISSKDSVGLKMQSYEQSPETYIHLKEDNGEVEFHGEKATGTLIENAPTANSTKLVTSGGVNTALAGKSDMGHGHTMGEVNGLVGALAGKASTEDLASKQDSTDNNLETTDKTIVGAINEIRASHGAVIEFNAIEGQLILTDQTPFGQMYHIDNSSLAAPINTIITTQEGGDNVHYHQGAGSMIADHFMIRAYRYEAEYFVEIAGAWDNIVPPQE